jgi:hypothetical protein
LEQQACGPNAHRQSSVLGQRAELLFGANSLKRRTEENPPEMQGKETLMKRAGSAAETIRVYRFDHTGCQNRSNLCVATRQHNVVQDYRLAG